MDRPHPSEYGEFYRGYVERVPNGDLAEALASQFAVTRGVLATIPPDRETHRYAADKWSVREVVGHLIDTERVFAGRALWVARQPGVELPGMDQDRWEAEGGHTERPIRDLLEEWGCVRESTLHLMTGLPEEASTRSGVASGSPVTVRSLFWILAGHELYHRERLREDYGIGA